MFKGVLIAILHKIFQKIEEEVTLPNSFYKVSVTLLLNPDKDITQIKTIE